MSAHEPMLEKSPKTRKPKCVECKYVFYDFVSLSAMMIVAQFARVIDGRSGCSVWISIVCEFFAEVDSNR